VEAPIEAMDASFIPPEKTIEKLGASRMPPPETINPFKLRLHQIF
jgi:hypothetical protein